MAPQRAIRVNTLQSPCSKLKKMWDEMAENLETKVNIVIRILL